MHFRRLKETARLRRCLIRRGQFRIGVSAHLAIDRRDFGITWNQVVEMGGVLVGNMVDIRIDAELTKRNVSE